MNGAQDLGGMMGFGPIAPEPNEPLFHAGWEKRAMALSIAAGACGQWNIDKSRHARETIPPAQYLAKSYYDIWATGLAKLVVAAGLASEEELRRGEMLTPPKPVKGRLEAAKVAEALRRGTQYDRPAAERPKFDVGARVRAREMNPSGHTRLPRYARGKCGEIVAVRGVFVFPDTNAHGLGENPQWCYTVAFSARELWGPEGDAGSRVSIDAFENYLEPA